MNSFYLKWLTILGPSIVMIIISLITYANSHADLKGIFVLSLLFFFPLLFFIQGALCRAFKTNFFVSLVLSSLTFLGILLAFLNSSAMIYILLYLIAGCLGYGVGFFLLKPSSAQNDKKQRIEKK